MTLTEGGEGGGGKGGSKWPDACLGKGGGGVNNWTKRLSQPSRSLPAASGLPDWALPESGNIRLNGSRPTPPEL